MLSNRPVFTVLWQEIAFVNLAVILMLTFSVFGIYQDDVQKTVISSVLLLLVGIKARPIFNVILKHKSYFAICVCALLLQTLALVGAKMFGANGGLLFLTYFLVFLSTLLCAKYLAKQQIFNDLKESKGLQ